MKNIKLLISMVFLIFSHTLIHSQQTGPPKEIKAVILDSTKANAIANIILEGDVAKAENKIFKEMDIVSKLRVKELKATNRDLLKSYKQKQKEADELNKSISEKNDALTKWKNKTTIFGVAGGTALFFGILAMIFR